MRRIPHFYTKILILIFCLYACKTETKKCSLRILSYEEKLDKFAQGKLIYPRKTTPIIFNNNLITWDSLASLDKNKFGLDYYVDCRDSIVKLRVRLVNNKDFALRIAIDSIYSGDINLAIHYIKHWESDSAKQKRMIEMAVLGSKIITHDVQCDSIAVIMDLCLKADQYVRTKMVIDTELMRVDRENIVELESILEKCGFLSIENAGPKAVYAAFIIVQHALPKFQKKYITLFEKASNKGYLKKANFAMLLDRYRVGIGEKQIYGSQGYYDPKIKHWIPNEIQEPAKIDSLRASMGMSSFKDYKAKMNQMAKPNSN